MSNSNTHPLMIELTDEVYSECKGIAERNGVDVETICQEFVQFALGLYREGKLQERSVDESAFIEIHDSELVN